MKTVAIHLTEPFLETFSCVLSCVRSFVHDILLALLAFSPVFVLLVVCLWLGNWLGGLLSLALGHTATTLLDELDSVLSNGTVLALDIDLSLNSLGGTAATALSLHLSVDVNSGRHAFAGAHVDSVVLSTFAELTVMGDGHSASEVSGNGTAANLFWSLAFDDAAVLGSVDELFWAVLDEGLSSGEALGVDVSLALLTSTSDALVFDGLPGVTDHSLLVLVVDAGQWDASTAASAGIGNSRVAHWTVTAAFSVADWDKESVGVWLRWAVASSTLVTGWHPSSSWEVSLAFPLAEAEWDAVASLDTWTLLVVSLNKFSTLWAFWAFGWLVADALADATAADNIVLLLVHTDWAWKSLGDWASLSTWVALALVTIAAVLLDNNVDVVSWAAELNWGWAVFLEATDALLLVDWLAAFAWSWDENLIGGHEDVTLAATDLELFVNWALRWITDAVELGTAFLSGLDEDLASAVASWWFWAVLWDTTADLVKVGAAFVGVAVLVFGDWEVVDVVDLTVNKVLGVTDGSVSAVVWVTLASELWAALALESVFSTDNSWVESVEHDSSFLTGNTVGSLVALESLDAHGWLADALSASAHSIAISLFLLPRSATEWLVVVEWIASVLAAAALSDWAAHVHVTLSITVLFSLAKAALFTENTGSAVLGNVGSARSALAPGLFAAAVIGHGRSEDLAGWARGEHVWAGNWGLDNHTLSSGSAVASALGAGAVARLPPFSNRSWGTVAVFADWTLPFVDASVALEDLAFWTEAALLGVLDESEHVEEVVPESVLASLDPAWAASGPDLAFFAFTGWAFAVVEDTPVAEHWHHVSVSPVVSAGSSLARALLSESVNGAATSLEGVVPVPSAVVDGVNAVLVSDLVVADLTELVVALHEVVVWINHNSAIVEVWVDICSPAVVGKVELALGTWKVSAEWDVLALAFSVADTVGWVGLLGLLENSSVVLLFWADLGWVEVSTLLGLDTLASDLWAFELRAMFWSTNNVVLLVVDLDLLVSVTFNGVKSWTLWALLWHTPSPVAIADTKSTGSVHVPSEPGEVPSEFDWIVSGSTGVEVVLVANTAIWASELIWLPVEVSHTDEKFTVLAASAHPTDITSDTGGVDTVWLALWNVSPSALGEAGDVRTVLAPVTVFLADIIGTHAFALVAAVILTDPAVALGNIFHTSADIKRAHAWFKIGVRTSLVPAVSSHSLDPTLEVDWSSLPEADIAGIVSLVTVTDTAKTKSTLAEGWRDGESPVISLWLPSEVKVVVLDEDGDLAVEVVDVVVLVERVDWGILETHHELAHDKLKILGDLVLDTSNVVLDDKVLSLWSLSGRTLVKEINEHLELVIASIVRELVLALGVSSDLELLIVEGVESMEISWKLGTLADALAHIGWTTALVGISNNWSGTVWTSEESWWAGVGWAIIHDFLAKTLASSATVIGMSELGADWVDLAVVSTTAFDVIVDVATVVGVLADDNELSAVLADTDFSWVLADVVVADASWAGAALESVLLLALFVEVVDNVAVWTLEFSGLDAFVLFALAHATAVHVSAFGVTASAGAWFWNTLDGVFAVVLLDTFADVATVDPLGAAEMVRALEGILTDTSVDWLARSTASIGRGNLDLVLSAHEKTIFVADRWNWTVGLLTVFDTVDTSAGRALLLPLLAWLLKANGGDTWAFAWVDESLAITDKASLTDEVNERADSKSGALARVGNVWASWDVAIASALIALIAAFWSLLSVTVTGNSGWGTETGGTAVDGVGVAWSTLLWVADADEVWADAAVLVGSVDSDNLLVGLAAWSLDLLADIEALVLNAAVGQAALVTEISEHSLVWKTGWLWLTELGSVVAGDEAVGKTSASVASVVSVVPFFAVSSLTALLVNTDWKWSSGRDIWGSGGWAFASGDHIWATTLDGLVLDSFAADFTGTDLWATLLWITDALPLEAFALFVLVEVVRVDLDKLLKTVSTFDFFHIWTLVALASSMPATHTVFIGGRNMLTSWAGSKIALLFDAWSWKGWSVSDPGWDTKLEDTDVWLALPDIIGFVSEVGTVDTWTNWDKFVVPLTLVNGADAVKENITTVVLVSSEDWFVVFWASLDSWAFSFWDTDALLHVAWAVDVSSLVTEAVAVVLKSNLLSTTAGSWEGLWTLAVATVGASLVDAAASIHGRVLGAESLLFTWNWVVAWLSGAVHSWYVVLKLALAELALGTWIRVPFVSDSVLDVVVDTESLGGWTDTGGVRVAVGGDVVNADLVVAAFVTSWWLEAKSVTAFLFAWVSKGELSTAAAGSSTALVEHLVTTGENKLAVVVTVLGNVGVWILVGSAIVDAWLVGLAWAVGTAAWAVWMLEDIVRLAGLAHWWLFEAELWSADTLLLLAIEVTGGVKSINVVSVGGLEAWGEARVSAHWSVAGNWHLWHWSWVSVDAHWWSLWALPSIAASAFTVVVLTVGLGDKDWITVLADWSGIADISDVGADNRTVVTAATGLAAVSDNWVGGDDLLPDLVGLVGDAFVFALEATVTCVREAAALVGA